MAQPTTPTTSQSSDPLEPLRLHRDYVLGIVYSEVSGGASRRRNPQVEWHSSIGGAEQAQRVSARCDALFQAADSKTNHLKELDEVFATFLYDTYLEYSEVPPATITTEVISVLSRLTARPPAPQTLPSSLPGCYFANVQSWDTLHVASFVPANLIRLVASTVAGRSNDPRYFHLWQFRTRVAVIINAVCHREIEQSAYQWFIVRAFLWTFWQRLNTLIRYFECKSSMRSGFSEGGPEYRELFPLLVCPGTDLVDFMAQASREGKPDNMCTWALELTRKDSMCVGLDLRLMHRRFTSIFYNVRARCRQNSTGACDGLEPNCLRYKGTHVSDQAAHADTCSFQNVNEPKLSWDEASYRRCRGARAVPVLTATAASTKLLYCSASDKTLAISHVWVHGQGGRPEVGINQCLHQRYCQIAQRLGCDSYWMDTVSIPQDHKLRREAISNINTVFANCRAVLVCDRDLMQVDVSRLTVPLQEALVVGVLLCDWNVRAWTLLEAVKGRTKLHLLCKGNRTVELQEVLRTVCDHGRLDVAVLINFLRHMLLMEGDASVPQVYSQSSDRSKAMRKLIKRKPNQDQMDIHQIQISVSLSGIWLSHRPASRPDDEIVIWSLLLGDIRPAYYNAVDFWKGTHHVDTGYLLSSCPRLDKAGRSWAPSTPYAMGVESGAILQPDRIDLPRYDVVGTLPGSIRKNGLWASWYVAEFDSRNQTSAQSQDQISNEIEMLRQRFHLTKRYAALLQPIYIDLGLFQHGEKRAECDIRPGRLGRLVAICQSSKRGNGKYLRKPRIFDDVVMPKSHCWLWKGVYEWPTHMPMPEFQTHLKLWIG